MPFVQSVGFQGDAVNSIQATLNGVAGGNFLATLNGVNVGGTPTNSADGHAVQRLVDYHRADIAGRWKRVPLLRRRCGGRQHDGHAGLRHRVLHHR